jgi:hypothetical protein
LATKALADAAVTLHELLRLLHRLVLCAQLLARLATALLLLLLAILPGLLLPLLATLLSGLLTLLVGDATAGLLGDHILHVARNAVDGADVERHRGRRERESDQRGGDELFHLKCPC